MMQIHMKALGTDMTGPSPVALAEVPAGVPSRASGLQGVAVSTTQGRGAPLCCVALLTHLSHETKGSMRRGEGMGMSHIALVEI
jgi:hypothetical protein